MDSTQSTLQPFDVAALYGSALLQCCNAFVRLTRLRRRGWGFCFIVNGAPVQCAMRGMFVYGDAGHGTTLSATTTTTVAAFRFLNHPTQFMRRSHLLYMRLVYVCLCLCCAHYSHSGRAIVMLIAAAVAAAATAFWSHGFTALPRLYK